MSTTPESDILAEASAQPSHDQEIRRFTLRADSSLDLLSSHLAAEFEVIAQESKKDSLALFDSYVWTLWFDGFVLLKSRTALELFARDGEWIAGRPLAGISLKGKCPRFVHDFSPSPLREELDDLLGYRALREVATIDWISHAWDLRNKQSKTVARLQIRELSAGTDAQIYVEILPLRGYNAEADAAARLIADVSDSGTSGPLGVLLRGAGATPVPYVLKPELSFSPTLGTRAAVCEAALKTLIVARSTETGMIHDWDSEFLHDYRVCLRRIRSVLSSIKGIFPEESLASWKDTLGKISRHTNQLRDLDVYLLSREEMTILLPEELRAGLTAFFADLSRARKSEFRKLRHYLESSHYLHLMTSLEEAFTHPESLPETAHSASPIIDEAAKRISKRFRRLSRLADHLDKDSPDEDIHSIRIAGKKLRYLLEFFGPLFPEEEIDTLTSLLSKLQSRLGQFNDTSVQQAYLLKYATSRAQGLEPRLAMSLGGLIAALYQEHGILKKEVRQAIKKFCTEANVDVIKDFIKADEEPAS